MNDNHSPNKFYLERWVTPAVLNAVKNYSVVVLTGARQVGKSTFLKNALIDKKWTYLTLDDFDVLETAQKNPGILLSGHDQLIIDEVQKAPKFLSAIKREVDLGMGKKRYLLSGSANLLLMHRVSESLAGRAVYHAMRPLTYGETKKEKTYGLIDALLSKRTISFKPKSDPGAITNILLRGFFPPAIVQFMRISTVIGWLEGYTATFIERDLQQLAQIDNLADFRRLMSILSLRSGQMLNQSEISRDANIPQPTVHRYLNLLETAFLIDKIPAYATNRTKRIIKTPKLYWIDCGLAAYLMGYHSSFELKKAREIGFLFENLVLSQIKGWAALKTPAPKIYYWRTTAGQEVDFVIESGKKLIAIEVKSSSTVSYSDTVNLNIFKEDYPETTAGIIAYAGKKLKLLGPNLWAVPWHMLS